jgi:protein-tyrosine-phosphatase
MLKECLNEAEKQKKTGELTAVDFDLIVAMARGHRELAEVK